MHAMEPLCCRQHHGLRECHAKWLEHCQQVYPTCWPSDPAEGRPEGILRLEPSRPPLASHGVAIPRPGVRGVIRWMRSGTRDGRRLELADCVRAAELRGRWHAQRLLLLFHSKCRAHTAQTYSRATRLLLGNSAHLAPPPLGVAPRSSSTPRVRVCAQQP